MALRFRVCSLVLGLLAAGALLAAESPPAPVKVTLKALEIPLSSHKAISAGISLRSGAPKDAPVGFDTLFQGTLGPLPVRFLHKGWDPKAIQMFLWPDRGKPVELARLEGGVSTYYLPFGPLALRGCPPVTVHFYFPPSTVSLDAFKTQAKTLYVLPMQCMAGEASIGGKKVLIALLDRNLNGSPSDFCAQSEQDGDWLLSDLNGDGALAVANFGDEEARGLTKFVVLNGRTWSVVCQGRDLFLKPVTLQTFKVRIAGLGSPSKFHAWSCAAGKLEAELDADGCAPVPRDRFQPWSYEWTREEWRLSGSLRGLGFMDAPASGEKAIEVGPKLACTLQKTDQPDGMKFDYRCTGRGKETVQVFHKGSLVQPVFLVLDAQGKEVFRKAQGFG